jgi:DNA topoisomerase-1
MPYIAVLVESPAKCGKIEKYLGAGYKCMATFGHLRSLENLNHVDISNNFTPTFTNVSSKSRQISALRTFINQADDVMLAADDDREGEAIAWHVCQLFNLPVNTTKRIIFHEITESALRSAVSSPTRINMEVVYAQHARQVLDLLVGFKISPILWSKISFKTKCALSAGRCQTPALRLIYDNQKEIDSSPGRKVYSTTGYFTKKMLPFSLDKNHEGEEAMEKFLEETVSHDHTYLCSEPRKSTKNPPTPYTTSAIQQAASNEMRLSPKATMEACQKLYEGGYITYMRTDSTTYSKEFIDTAKVIITNTYGVNFVHPEVDALAERKGGDEKKGKKKKGKKKEEDSTAQEAHEAIRPTDLAREAVDDTLENREAKLYAMIRRNTLESCMAAATYTGVTGKVTAPEEATYKYSTEQVVFPGWKVVAGYEETNPNYQYLLTLKPGPIDYKKVTSKVTMKDLKNHFTEAKLVQMLEQRGIGRPSTFSSLVDKIQARGYVKKTNVEGKEIECVDFTLEDEELSQETANRSFGGERGKLVIQPVGILVVEFLLEHFGPLFEYDYTKAMEDTLDQIAKGNSIWHELCRSCLNQIDELAEPLGSVDKQMITIDEDHTYMVAKYGPVIKCVKNGKTSFKKVKEDIDLDKLRRGEYSLSEIVLTNAAKKSRILGEVNSNNVELKNGRFGMYVDYDGAKYTVNCEKPFEEVTIDDVREVIDNSLKPRKLNGNASIRKGKYGPYIYYKTVKMSKPRFLDLKRYDGDFMKDPISTITEWANQTYKIKL